MSTETGSDVKPLADPQNLRDELQQWLDLEKQIHAAAQKELEETALGKKQREQKGLEEPSHEDMQSQQKALEQKLAKKTGLSAEIVRPELELTAQRQREIAEGRLWLSEDGPHEAARRLICRQAAQRLVEAKNNPEKLQRAIREVWKQLNITPAQIALALARAAGDPSSEPPPPLEETLGNILINARTMLQSPPPTLKGKLGYWLYPRQPQISGGGIPLAAFRWALFMVAAALKGTAEEPDIQRQLWERRQVRRLYEELSRRTGMTVDELLALELEARSQESYKHSVCDAIAKRMVTAHQQSMNLEAHQKSKNLQEAFNSALRELKLSPEQLNGMSAREAEKIFRAVEKELKDKPKDTAFGRFEGMPTPYSDVHHYFHAWKALNNAFRQRAFKEEQGYAQGHEASPDVGPYVRRSRGFA